MADNTFMDSLQYWLDEYLPTAEGKKPNTIKSYKDTWRLLTRYMLEQGIGFADITYEMLDYDRIMDFLKWLENERGCKVSTRNNRLSALSKFAKYSQNCDFNSAYVFAKAILKIPFKKGIDSVERAFFTQEEVKILLDLPTPRSCMGARDHTLLQFMYASGERADEVCQTTVADIRFLSDNKASILVHGKGGKTRRIKISEKPTSTLKKYIHRRGIANNPSAFIFPSQRNEKMSVKCIEEIFEKYVRIAKENNPSLFQAKSYPPHSMRHTTAVHMLEAGVPLIVIKQFLGHANLETTEIYAKLTPEAMARKIVNWDKEYWNSYMDEPVPESYEKDENDSGIPDFLK